MYKMGFEPSKYDPDIWLRRKGDLYEYIAVYVDDLCIISKDPQAITDELVNTYKLKLKGTGEIKYHLGANYYRDKDGTLCQGAEDFIKKMEATYKRFYGEDPKKMYSSPLEKNDHPEIDLSDLLDEEGIHQYQSLVGSLQWLISLGRFDVQSAVATMSSFRAAPRQGHLDRVKRIIGFVSKFREGATRFRTEEPDFSQIEPEPYNWIHSIYGEAEEIIPDDAPEPLGKPVLQTSYVDANLAHNFVNGRSLTGVIHLFNQTPVESYSKLQGTVEWATYGSEFNAAKTATEQMLELRLMLRYLGVPVKKQMYLFGDNQSVVTSATIPDSKIKKRHLLLAYHYVREKVAAGILNFVHIPGEINPADIVSKHWAYHVVSRSLKALLYHTGNTMDYHEGTDADESKGSNNDSIQTDHYPGANPDTNENSDVAMETELQ